MIRLATQHFLAIDETIKLTELNIRFVSYNSLFHSDILEVLLDVLYKYNNTYMPISMCISVCPYLPSRFSSS